MNGIGFGNSMFLATHGILARSGGGGASLLLDTYTGAAVAYSLRQLRTAYTGAAIRVRRSSDNAEQDINFVGGDLDTQSLLDFVGYNLLTYSEDISQSVYTKNGLNTTGIPAYIDVEIAPDGTLTGDKIIESIGTGNHNVQRSSTGISLIIGQSYNISVYLKQAERTKIRISSQISGSVQTCEVDLTNGNISNNGFANTPVVTAEANGWYRFSVTITSGLVGTQPFSVQLSNGSSFSYTGDGTSGVYVWGFQLTKSSSVLTYEKTGASVTKDAYITTWYDQSTNANNATQATAASQAQIVASGAVITDPNTSKISTTWTTDFYSLGTGISPNTRYLSVGVVNRTSNLTNLLVSMGTATLTGVNGQCPMIWLPTSGNVNSIMPSLVTHGTNTGTGAFIMTSEKNASNLKTAYLDGVALSTTATEAPSAGNNFIYFGRAGNNFHLGRYAEYIYWNSEQSANRTAIETNINTYWNAY